MLRSTRGNFADGRPEAGRPMAWNNDRVDACCIGRTHARAEIVRILYPVEYQQQ